MVGSSDSSRSNTKKLMVQSGLWCKDDSCVCAPEHVRHLSVRESLSLDRDKGAEERARTFTDIVQDFKFSKGTHVDIRSQSDPPEGSEPRHLSGIIFLRTATKTSGTSSSKPKTETITVAEPPVVPSDTKVEEPIPATSDCGYR